MPRDEKFDSTSGGNYNQAMIVPEGYSRIKFSSKLECCYHIPNLMHKGLIEIM